MKNAYRKHLHRADPFCMHFYVSQYLLLVSGLFLLCPGHLNKISQYM